MSGNAEETKNMSQKVKEDGSIPEVHSANSWESVDLGDSERKQKFLRLMGASKKEHHGRFVIGDSESKETHQNRSQVETKKLSNDLESQYEQSMEHRRIGGRRGHIGLGFHKEEEDRKEEERKKEEEERKKEEEEIKEKEEKNESPDETKESTEGKEEKDNETGEKQRTESESEKRQHSDDSQEADRDSNSSAKKMKMTFVKASS